MDIFTKPSVLAAAPLLLVLVACGDGPTAERRPGTVPELAGASQEPRPEADETPEAAPGSGPEAPHEAAEDGPESPKATPAWAAAMQAGRLEDAAAALTLWRLEEGPGSPVFQGGPALAALDEALVSEHTELRLEALRALVVGFRDRDPGSQRLALLGGKLGDPDHRVRAEAASVLHAVGPPARSQAAPLVQALADAEEVVRVNASHAFVRIKPPLAVSGAALRRILADDPSDEVRTHAALALGEVAATWDETTGAALIAALEDAHGEVRAAAVWALTEAPAFGRRALARIKALAEDETPDVRYAVEQALRRLGETR